MNREADRRCWLIAALLLRYPSEALAAELPLLAGHAAHLPARLGDPLRGLADALAARPVPAAAADYTQTFDFTRRCSLHLTYHTHGDTRTRGAALLAFRRAYTAAGLEPADDELPDFLPMVLEFAAAGPPAGATLLADHRVPLEMLRRALHHADSPYRLALDAVCGTLPDLSDVDESGLRRLLSHGPPTESVGLEPFAVGGGRR